MVPTSHAWSLHLLFVPPGNSFPRLEKFSTNTTRKPKETIRNKLKGGRDLR